MKAFDAGNKADYSQETLKVSGWGCHVKSKMESLSCFQ